MLEQFLSYKPLYYEKIDYTRMPRVYERIKSNFPQVKIIHLVGTNAKGTTGRFLASALNSLGLKVGHYTSPHILNFNERIWIDGSDISDKTLEDTHLKLLNILNSDEIEELSYFEYTTLLAMLAFNKCEFVVMEAGLGGYRDATAVFDKILTLVTPIALDHESFLGNSIKEIATTKLKAIQNNAILAPQQYEEVYNVAKIISKSNNLKIVNSCDMLDENDNIMIAKIAKNLSLENYLIRNLAHAVSAFKFLNIEYFIDSFANSRLFGRLTHIGDNIIVDVGHNPLAAKAITDTLSNKKYTLIYNSYKDKDYKKIVQILKPIIKNVEIIPIDDDRVEKLSELQKVLKDLEIEYGLFSVLRDNENYLVFGSFRVVEVFMKRFIEE